MVQQPGADRRNGASDVAPAPAPFSVGELRRFYAAMACGVSVLDASGTILYANDAAERILGLTIDQLSGRTALDPRWGALREDGSASAGGDHPSMRALRTGQAVHGAITGVQLPGGERRWLQVDAVPIRDPEGLPTHVVVSFIDITRHRDTERRLAAVIALQDAVAAAGFDLPRVMALIADQVSLLTEADGATIGLLEGGDLVYRHTTGSAAPFHGLRVSPMDGLAGRSLRTGATLRCDDAERDDRVDRALCARLGVRSFVSVPLREGRGAVGVLLVWAAAPRRFSERDAAALRLMAGVLAAAVGRARAFRAHQALAGERGAALVALRASEERYRQVEEHAPIGLALLAPDGRWLRVNRALCDIVGYSREELLARTFGDITHPDDLDADLANVERLLAGAIDTYQMEKRYVHKGGRVVRALLSVSLVRDEAGQPLSFISQIQDIGERARAEGALRASEERFRATFDRAPVGIAHLDLDGRWVRVNPRLCEMLGCTPAELLGRTFGEITHPGEDPRPNLDLLARLRAGEIDLYDLEKRYLRPDGVTVWASVRVSVVRDGPSPYLVSVLTDITARKRAEEALAASQARFRVLVEGAPLGICILDEAGCFEDVNDAYAVLLGYTREELLRQPFALVMAEERRAPALAALRAQLSTGIQTMSEEELRSKDGSTRTALSTGIAIQGLDGRPLRAIFGIDITERKRLERETARQATHDALTGLPNRAFFDGQLARALATSAPERPLALLLIDLDRFKEVNDTLGHQAGDELLCQVAARLRGALRPEDTVARLGGDEFAVLLPRTDEVAAVRVADRLRAALDAPLRVAGHPVSVDVSTGIALAPAQGADATTLLRHADVAMYEAKAAGGGCAVYRAERDRHSPGRLGLAGELRRAIGTGQLRLHYQPIATCRSGHIERLEALARWQHPAHGLLPPAQFVPLAETLGLITPLTLWVLEEALGQCRGWHDEGFPVGVAVNATLATVQDPQFPDLVAALLRRHGLAAACLTVELTETMLMAQPAAAAVAALGASGVRVAMDDFGTGHSSLAHLRQLAVREIKIDRSLVQKLASERDGTLMAFMLGLVGALGCTAVAEGVETQEMWDWLVGLGCEAIQGYHLSRPMPADAVARWLRARPPGVPRT